MIILALGRSIYGERLRKGKCNRSILDVKLDPLADYDRIYRDKASASSTENRPELKNVLP